MPEPTDPFPVETHIYHRLIAFLLNNAIRTIKKLPGTQQLGWTLYLVAALDDRQKTGFVYDLKQILAYRLNTGGWESD